MLPELLSSAGPLPARHPRDGEEIRERTIYIAPPDFHMLLEPNLIRLSHGPKENFARPAINPLFRSAAASFGSRVVGVLLSGDLDDGVLGLAEIKQRGGKTIVQNPKTATFQSMPLCAIGAVEVDHIAIPEDIPALFEPNMHQESVPEKETTMEQRNSMLTCPECRGPLTETQSGNLSEYRCRVGHAYSPLGLAEDHRDTAERKLWEAVLVLEESADIADLLAQSRPEYSHEAKIRRDQALTIREILNDLSLRAPLG